MYDQFGPSRHVVAVLDLGWFTAVLAVAFAVLGFVSAIALRLANGWVKADGDLRFSNLVRVATASSLVSASLVTFAISGIALMRSGRDRLLSEPMDYVAVLLAGATVGDVSQTAFFVTLGNAAIFRQLMSRGDGTPLTFAAASALAVVHGAIVATAWLMMCLATSATVTILVR